MIEEEPTKAQIKEFWEWCGFKKAGGGWTNVVYKYPVEIDQPDPNSIFDGKYDPLPPIDLNNLFKYAVPKLREYYKKLSCPSYYYSPTLLLEDWISEVIEHNEDPALALFWTIWEEIHG